MKITYIKEGAFGGVFKKYTAGKQTPEEAISAGKKLAKTAILNAACNVIKPWVSDKLCQYCDEVHAEAQTNNDRWSPSDREKLCKIPVVGNSSTKHIENIIVKSETDSMIKILIPIVPGIGQTGSAIFMLYFLDNDTIMDYCKNRLQEDLAKYTGDYEDVILSYKYDIKFYFDKTPYISSDMRNQKSFASLINDHTFGSNADTNIYIDKLKDFVDLLDGQKLDVKEIKMHIKGDATAIHLEKLLSLVQYNKIELNFVFDTRCDKNSMHNHISNCINAVQNGKRVVVSAGLWDERVSYIVYDFIFRTYLSTTLKDVLSDLNKQNRDGNYNAIHEIKFVMGNPIKASTLKVTAFPIKYGC